MLSLQKAYRQFYFEYVSLDSYGKHIINSSGENWWTEMEYLCSTFNMHICFPLGQRLVLRWSRHAWSRSVHIKFASMHVLWAESDAPLSFFRRPTLICLVHYLSHWSANMHIHICNYPYIKHTSNSQQFWWRNMYYVTTCRKNTKRHIIIFNCSTLSKCHHFSVAV